MDADKPSQASEFVLSSLDTARKRIMELKTETQLRDINTIWETYCDIEQSIEVSKYLFKLHDRLGTYRRLTASAKNNPVTLPKQTLISIYESVDSSVVSAAKAVKDGRGLEAIELARHARDQLKVLLLGLAKSEQLILRRKTNKETSSLRTRWEA